VFKLVQYLLILSCLISLKALRAQSPFLGVWKGAIFSNSISDTSTKITYFNITKFKNICDINIRVEQLQTTSFYVFRLSGNYNPDSLEFKDIVFDSKSMIQKTKDKCKLKLEFNDSSGYLIGEIYGPKDKILLYKLVLFKTSEEFISAQKKEVNHAWFYFFQKEFSMGMVAPQKRDFERNNFQFQSVYFEPAKAELSSEYHTYLKGLINVINGHTDLRLKVIGHTDWDGSDQYNEDLSKKRAESIIQFLELNGLARDRIEYEYQGEKKPADTNKTSEGKKRNRRVDFQFI
jgi:outer membrane protein OmpA-like peptidoglycan-associated protein